MTDSTKNVLRVSIEMELDRLEANLQKAGYFVDAATTKMDKSTKKIAESWAKEERKLRPIMTKIVGEAERLNIATGKLKLSYEKTGMSADRYAENLKLLNDRYDQNIAKINANSEAGRLAAQAAEARASAMAEAAQAEINFALGIDRTTKSARESADTLELALQAAEARAAASMEAAQADVNLRLGIDRTTKSAQASAAVFEESARAELQAAQATKALAAEKVTLRAKYSPLGAAQQRYLAQLQEIRQAVSIGALDQREYATALATVKAGFAAQVGQINGLVGQHAGLNKVVQAGTSRLSHHVSAQRHMGLAAQNSAYQIGDFAVQVAAGTHWTRALAMQLPQLLGGFGVMGAVFGAVAAIGGALIPVFMDIGSASGGAKDEADRYTAALKKMADMQEESRVRQLRLNDAYLGAVANPINERIKSLEKEIALYEESGKAAMDAAAVQAGLGGIGAFGALGSMLDADKLIELRKELAKALETQRKNAADAVEDMVLENTERAKLISLAERGVISITQYTARQEALTQAKKLNIDVLDKETGKYTAQYSALLSAIEGTEALNKAEQELKKTRKEVDVSGFVDYSALATDAPDTFRQKIEKRIKDDERARARILSDYDRMREAGGDSVAALEDWRLRSMEGLDSAATGYDDFARKVEDIYQQRLPDARRKDLISSREWSAGAQIAFEDYQDSVTNSAAHANAAVTRGMKGMEDALVGWTSRTKTAGDSFREFANGVIVDMQRMLIQQGVTGPLSGVLGGLIKGIAGGIMGGGAPDVGGFGPAVPGVPTVMTAHTGWASGDSAITRSSDPAIFNGASRYHSGRVPGLASFEEPAIIRKDEGVFTQGQMKAMGTRMNAGPSINLTDARVINVSGNGVTRADVEAALAAEKPKWTRDAVNQSKIAVQRENVSNPNYLRA